LYETESLAESA